MPPPRPPRRSNAWKASAASPASPAQPSRRAAETARGMIAFMLMLAPVQAAATTGCYDDRAALLALDQKAFDQDLAGGWRAVAASPGCELAAADLIRDYRTS